MTSATSLGDATASAVYHASARLAAAVSKLLASPADARNLTEWARIAGTSPSSLRTWCRAARVRPKNALDCSRLLRICVRFDGDHWEPLEALNIVDTRTLHSLLRRSGCPNLLTEPMASHQFAVKQTLVNSDHFVAAVLQVLDAFRKKPTETGS